MDAPSQSSPRHHAPSLHQYAQFLPDSLVSGAAVHREQWITAPAASIHSEVHGPHDASHRVLLLHGAGGHAGMLRPYAAALATRGCRVLVPDLPGYGRTRVADPGAIRYEHWILTATVLMKRERRDFSGPITVVGASMGGLLAYDVATRTGLAQTVVATCLLDPSDRAARRAISRFPSLGPAAIALTAGVLGPVARLQVPVRYLTQMGRISNNPDLTRAVVNDPLGGGNSMPLGFLRSYLRSRPAVPPRQARGLRVVLAHPGQDRWTPLDLSLAFFNDLACPRDLVVLEGAGHLPAEQPGVDQLLSTVVAAGQH